MARVTIKGMHVCFLKKKTLLGFFQRMEIEKVMGTSTTMSFHDDVASETVSYYGKSKVCFWGWVFSLETPELWLLYFVTT